MVFIGLKNSNYNRSTLANAKKFAFTAAAIPLSPDEKNHILLAIFHSPKQQPSPAQLDSALPARYAISEGEIREPLTTALT
jgi:hypothetical protein